MMYGGTCINIACLPTKNLVINSQRGVKYEEAFETKEAMTAKTTQQELPQDSRPRLGNCA